jgi:hypothetical protein
VSTVNSVGLLKGEFRMPIGGAWHADIEAEPELDVSEGVEIEVDGVTFVGTAIPGRHGVNGTRYVAKIVGGAGGLSQELPAKSYEHAQGVKVRAILEDILRSCGETLSATAETATLETKLPRWSRIKSTAARQILKLADELGCSWRVLADGTVWVGQETWPETTVEHVLEDEDWERGRISIAPESPSLTPGITFLEQRIETVYHTVDGEGRLRTDCMIEGKDSTFKSFLKRLRKDIDYSRLYRCRVVSQNADLTVQLEPDSDVVKGRGLDKVPIRCDLPGAIIRVSKGARCMFGFNGGDPSDPFACHFDMSDAGLVSITFGRTGVWPR